MADEKQGSEPDGRGGARKVLAVKGHPGLRVKAELLVVDLLGTYGTWERLGEATKRSESAFRKPLTGKQEVPLTMNILSEAALALDLSWDDFQRRYCSDESAETRSAARIVERGAQADSMAPGLTVAAEWRRIGESIECAASNGVLYWITPLRLPYLDRVDRGKEYDLRSCPARDRRAAIAMMRRHLEVCRRLSRPHPYLSQPYAVESVREESLTVIDEWFDLTLETRLSAETCNAASGKMLLSSISEGVRALHEAGVIRRELAPRNVGLRQPDIPVLMDFELAKLTQSVPTVSSPGTWVREDPYLDPVLAAGGVAKLESDTYSFAKIAAHLANGRPPEPGRALQGSAFKGTWIPPKLATYLCESTKLLQEDRPPAGQLHRFIERWK